MLVILATESRSSSGGCLLGLTSNKKQDHFYLEFNTTGFLLGTSSVDPTGKDCRFKMLILHFQTWKLLSVFLYSVCGSRGPAEVQSKKRERKVDLGEFERVVALGVRWADRTFLETGELLGFYAHRKRDGERRYLSEKWFSGGKGLIRWHSLEKHDLMCLRCAEEHFWMHNMLKLWNRSPHRNNWSS